MVLFLVRLIVRLEWLSVLITGLCVMLVNLGSENVLLEAPTSAITAALLMFILVRFGFLALLFSQFFANLILSAPFSLDFSHWYATRGAFVILLLLAVWGWGLKMALGGKPILKFALDE